MGQQASRNTTGRELRQTPLAPVGVHLGYKLQLNPTSTTLPASWATARKVLHPIHSTLSKFAQATQADFDSVLSGWENNSFFQSNLVSHPASWAEGTVFANRMLFPAQLAGQEKTHSPRSPPSAPRRKQKFCLGWLGQTLRFKLKPLILALPRHAAHQNVPCDKENPMHNLVYNFRPPALRR